ncbi:MAG: hypothetical protein AAGF06_06735 [Pseudomonadota bacterium]
MTINFRTLISKFLFICSSVLLLTLLVLGLMHNHADILGLDKRTISTPAIRQMYPEQFPVVKGIKAGSHWYYPFEDYIYKDELPWQKCDGLFVGVVNLDKVTLLICNTEINLYDKYEQLIDKMTSSYGLPIPITRVGLIKNQLFVESQGLTYNLDLESMETFQAVIDDQVRWQRAELLPAMYQEPIHEEKGVSVKLLLAELFGGLFSGILGIVLIDLLLLFGIFLCGVFIKDVMYSKKDKASTGDDGIPNELKVRRDQ